MCQLDITNQHDYLTKQTSKETKYPITTSNELTNEKTKQNKNKTGPGPGMENDRLS